MKNLEVITPDQADPATRKVFQDMEKKLGMVPNLYAATANSGKALSALLTLSHNLSNGEFTAKETEAIALSVGQANDCAYCLAAHTGLAKSHGFSGEEALQIRKAETEDEKLNALLMLIREITLSRGRPEQASIDRFFSAGYSRAALAELIAQVANNTFTNYMNHIADTPIDFPLAPDI
jgi:uncharacterized peroxidase-related enzyme